MRCLSLTPLLFLLCLLNARAQETPAVVVPAGSAPTIDGLIETDEWADAVSIPLTGGQWVFLKRSASYLYLAVQGRAGGIGSLGVYTEGSIRILHASTGLITAAFERHDGQWRVVQEFTGPTMQSGEPFPRGEARQGPQYRQAKLEQFGWTANVVELGPPSDLEYQILLSDPDNREVRIAVVFFQIQATTRIAFAPTTLADDSFDRELIAGSVRTGLRFAPEHWQPITW